MLLSVLSVLFELLNTIFGDILADSVKDFIEKRIFVIGKRYSCDKIIENPNLIMGDRASEGSGFQEDLYCRRDVDDDLSKYVELGIVVIEGRPASGKSRAVWEFIRESGGKYKSIYILRPQNNSNDKYSKKLNGEVGCLSKSTLIVIDELENFNKKMLDEAALCQLLQTINERKLPCIITISNIHEYYDDICKIIRNDASLGSQKIRKINFLTIDDIERNDDTYCWCTNNFKITKHSRAIGGYVASLSRHVDVTQKAISANPGAAVYFTAVVILRKFRNRSRTMVDRAECLYKKIRDKDNLFGIPENPADNGINNALFKSGVFSKDDDTIIVNDEFLFESLLGLCTQAGRSVNCSLGPCAEKYLSNTKESEEEQIERLLAMDPTDPLIYSRIMTRSQYPANIKNFNDRFNRQFFKTKVVNNRLVPFELNPKYQKKKTEISFTISIFIGRDKSPKTRCEEYINSGIGPTIEIVNELLRAAHNTRSLDDRNDIVTYAENLKKNYDLKGNLFYYQMLEQLDSNYEEERIKKFMELYPLEKNEAENEEDGDARLEKLEGIEINKLRYFSYLTQKANSPDKLDSYFKLLKNYPDLQLKKSAIRKLVTCIKGNASCYKKLADELLVLATSGRIDVNVRNTGLICIMDNCEDLDVDLAIYNHVHQEIYKNIDSGADDERYLTQSQKKLLNILSKGLAIQMGKKGLDDKHYDAILKILKDRIRSSYATNDRGSADKLFNVVLNNQPLYPMPEAIENLITLYNDPSLKDGKRDIDNLNSAFDNAINAYNAWKDATQSPEDLAIMFETLRQEDGIVGDECYDMMLFKIRRKLEDNKESDAKVEKMISFDSNILNETAILDNELLWCQIIHLSNDCDLQKKIAENCIKLVEKNKYPISAINHLYSAFCDRFRDNGMFKQLLQKLKDATFDNITHTAFDYQNYLKFDAVTGNIKTVDEVKSYLEVVWNKLQSLKKPLIIPSKADLLMVAISLDIMDVNNAIEIFDFAIKYDRNNIYGLLSIDALVALSQKFKKKAGSLDKSEIETAYGYKKEIQRIINSIDSIKYDEESANKVKTPVNDYFKSLRDNKTFVCIPFELGDKKVRRGAFMNRINSGVYCTQYEVERFLYQEFYWANKQILNDINNSKKSSIDDYIDNILNAIKNTEKMIDMETIHNKQKHFLLTFSEKAGWDSYDNFFQAYLAKNYVPEKSLTEWKKVAEFYGFNIQ